MVRSKYLKSTSTWVRSSLFGRIEKFNPRFSRSSMSLVSTILDLLNTMFNICFFNLIISLLEGSFFINYAFIASMTCCTNVGIIWTSIFCVVIASVWFWELSDNWCNWPLGVVFVPTTELYCLLVVGTS